MEATAIISSEFSKVVCPLVRAAKNSIKIIVYDWRWYSPASGSPVSTFNLAILAARKRGVRVQVLSQCAPVLETLRREGCEAKHLHSKKMLHTKMLLLDDEEIVIGSHNYTNHGFSLNHEASIYVKLSSPQNKFQRYFDDLFATA
jgi:phosphatidylserine/phosphatidylglycerophosphate/cardiolipin synthase-like enzyme